MIGTIATLVGLAGQMAGGIMSANANAKSQRQSDQETARQVAELQIQKNQNPLSRSENQALLGEMDRRLERNNQISRNVAKITDATPEYALAQQKNTAEAYADAISNMASGESARRDKLTEDINSVQHDKALQDIARTEARQQTYAQIMQNSGKTASAMLGGYDSKEAPTTTDGTTATTTTDKTNNTASAAKQNAKKTSAYNYGTATKTYA